MSMRDVAAMIRQLEHRNVLSNALTNRLFADSSAKWFDGGANDQTIQFHNGHKIKFTCIDECASLFENEHRWHAPKSQIDFRVDRIEWGPVKKPEDLTSDKIYSVTKCPTMNIHFSPPALTDLDQYSYEDTASELEALLQQEAPNGQEKD